MCVPIAQVRRAPARLFVYGGDDALLVIGVGAESVAAMLSIRAWTNNLLDPDVVAVDKAEKNTAGLVWSPALGLLDQLLQGHISQKTPAHGRLQSGQSA